LQHSQLPRWAAGTPSSGGWTSSRSMSSGSGELARLVMPDRPPSRSCVEHRRDAGRLIVDRGVPRAATAVTRGGRCGNTRPSFGPHLPVEVHRESFQYQYLRPPIARGPGLPRDIAACGPPVCDRLPAMAPPDLITVLRGDGVAALAGSTDRAWCRNYLVASIAGTSDSRNLRCPPGVRMDLRRRAIGTG